MNRLYHFLPYVVMVLTVLNTVVQYKTGLRPYLYVGVLSICLACFQFLSFSGKRHSETGLVYLALFIAWVAVVFILELLLGGFYEGRSLAFKSIFSLVWATIFWLLFSYSTNGFDRLKFIRFQIYLAVGVVAIGFVQKFLSLNLFGFLPDVKWQEHFEGNLDTYRVTSLLSSPQVYGLYCAIMAAVAMTVPLRWSKWIVWSVVAFIAAGGLISGNKSVAVCLLVALTLKVKLPGKWITMPILGLCAAGAVYALGISNSSGEDGDGTLSRSAGWIFNISGLIEREQHGRVAIYSNIFKTSNPILGNGLGCTAADEGTRGVIPESHMLLLFVEAGGPALLIFLAAMIFIYNRAKKMKDETRRYCVLLVALSAVFVHAATYPAFFGIWGIVIMGGLNDGRPRRILRKAEIKKIARAGKIT